MTTTSTPKKKAPKSSGHASDGGLMEKPIKFAVEIEADTIEDLAFKLQDLATEALRGHLTSKCAFGGGGTRGSYELERNPNAR